MDGDSVHKSGESRGSFWRRADNRGFSGPRTGLFDELAGNRATLRAGTRECQPQPVENGFFAKLNHARGDVFVSRSDHEIAHVFGEPSGLREIARGRIFSGSCGFCKDRSANRRERSFAEITASHDSPGCSVFKGWMSYTRTSASFPAGWGTG